MNAPISPSPSELLAHTGFVRGIAHAALRGDGSVDDVVQETWLAALKGGPRSQASSRSWLARVVRNISFGMIRRDRRRLAREQATARPPAVPSTAAIAEREETRKRLLEALARVSEPSRSALVLRYYEDLPPREVAKRLDVPVETARTRIKRGLTQLRTELDRRYDGDRKQWAVALLPLAGDWTRNASTALGAKALAGVVGAAAVITVVVIASGEKPKAEEEDATSTTAAVVKNTPTLAGAAERPTPPPSGNSVAFGRITANGQPVKAVVALRKTDRGDGASTQTDANGTYRLEQVEPGTLWIEIPGEPRIRHRSGLTVDGQHARTDVSLPSTRRSIAGRITYSDGRPFTGTVEMYGAAHEPTFVTETDTAGHYAFPRAPDTILRITAVIPERLKVLRSFPPGTADFGFVIDDGMTMHRGRVLEEKTKKPIASVRVHAFRRDNDRDVRIDAWAHTDSDGAFLVPGLEEAVIQLSHRDYPEGVVRKEKDGTKYLRPAGVVHGVVRGPSGEPAAGVRVAALTFSTNYARRRETHTDSQGRYSMAVAPGQVAVYAYGPTAAYTGIAAWRRKAAVGDAFELVRGERVEHDLTLHKTGSLVGTVVDEQDRPIVGALVELRHHRDSTIAHGLYLRPVQRATDANGAFRLPGMVPGIPYRVQASRFDYPDVRPEEVFTTNAAGEVRTTVRLQRPREARVTVVNARTNEPVAGVEITLGRRKSPYVAESAGSVTAVSRADGSVSIPGLPRAPLLWRTNAPDGFVDDGGWFPLPESDEGGDFEATVTLEPEMRLAGRVIAPDGVSLKAANVDVEGIDDNGTAPEGGGPVQTDGSFKVSGLPHGSYRLRIQVTHGGSVYSAETVVRDDAENIVLKLQDVLPPGAWRIRVTGPDGRPRKAFIARFVGNTYVRTTWDSVAQLEPLAPGVPDAYVLAASSVGPRSPDNTPGAVLVGPLSHEGRVLDLTLPPGRVLDGQIQFEDGKPLANHRLVVRPVVPGTRSTQHNFIQNVRTDAQGRFRLRGLGALAYRISFQPLSNGWTPEPVLVHAEAIDADFTLAPPPEAIRLEIRDPNGDPAGKAGISVYAHDAPKKAVLHTQAHSDGIAQLLGLTRGKTYYLVVRKWGKASASYEQRDWQAAPATIDLVAERPFEGVVKDPAGAILRRVRLYRRTPLNTWRLLNERGGARFALRLPPGRHFIQPVAYTQEPAEGRGTWVESGDTNVVLTLDPGPTLRAQVPGGFRTVVSVQREGDMLKKEPSAWADKEGILEVTGLESDATYVLWASPDRNENNPEKGVCIYRKGLRADGVLRTFTSWSKSVPVRGTVQVPKGHRPEHVRLLVFVAGMREWVRVNSDGSFRARGLPEGRWRLVATLATGAGELRAEAPTRGADPVELVLSK